MGYFIGVGGVVTFKNAKKLVKTVETIPLSSIVLETDCPYMAPEPHRGTRNDSRNIPYVIAKIAEILNEVLTKDQSTIVLLETMSGKGTEVGRNFEELRQIIDRVELKDKLGVCLDTCHVWDGGYDIVNDLDSVFEEFDRIIGLDRLKAIHLNDSMNPLGSHKDRHARIGEGEIGLEALVRVINHPATEGIPFILETPNDDEGWTHEIALLRNEYKQK